MPKVCGEFPEFCYKGFDCEEHAKLFIEQGTFRMGCLLSYGEIQDKKRCDPTEGTGCIKTPGIVTSVWFSKNPAEKPIVMREWGHVEHTPTHSNAKFCLCMSLPDVDLGHMKNTFGNYVIKINDPRQLAEDIDDFYISKGPRILIGGCRVVYNKGQTLDAELPDNEMLDLSYKQKPEHFSADREFRIVAIKFGEPCPNECHFLDGQFEQVAPECRFKNSGTFSRGLVVTLGKPLNYVTGLW